MSEPAFEMTPTDGEAEAAPALPPGARLALTTTLRRLELTARRLEERLLCQEAPPLALTLLVNPFTPEERAELLKLLAALRSEVARLARTYRLPASRENLRSVLLAEFGLLWSDLEELRPAHLRDYGELSASAARSLEPQLERLIRLTLAINERAGQPRPAPPTDEHR